MKTYISQDAIERELVSLVNKTLVIEDSVTIACNVLLRAGMIVVGDLVCRDLIALDLVVTGNIHCTGNLRVENLQAGNITGRNLKCRDLTARHITLNGNLACFMCRVDSLNAGRVSLSTLLAEGRVVASEIKAHGDIIAREIDCSGDITYRGVAVAYERLRCRTIRPTQAQGRHLSLLGQVVETGVK